MAPNRLPAGRCIACDWTQAGMLPKLSRFCVVQPLALDSAIRV